MPHKTIAIESLHENVFTILNKDWMLITAGTEKSFNTMTASWGGFGFLWNRPVAYIVVRPTRYTYEFIERSDRFTLSFFPNQYRKALSVCGSQSGRDIDKPAVAGITPVITATGAVYFSEARLIFECSKIYHQDLNPDNFIDPAIDGNYPDKDYHRLYVGEIHSVLESC